MCIFFSFLCACLCDLLKEINEFQCGFVQDDGERDRGGQPHPAAQQWSHVQQQRINGPPSPHTCQTVRSPLKFVKGEFRESDYESDYECRIQPIWRPPYESAAAAAAADGPVYKPVRPGFRSLAGTGRTDIGPAPRPAGRQPPAATRDFGPAFELKPGSPPEIGFAPSPTMTVGNVQENATSTRTQHVVAASSHERNAAEAKRLQRVDEMRKRFEQKSLVPADEECSSALLQTAVVSSSFASNHGQRAPTAGQ